MEPIFHRVLSEIEDFNPEDISDILGITSFLQGKLDAAINSTEVLEIYHTLRQLSYNSHPNNRLFSDSLTNNRTRFNISSYFDIPSSPQTLLASWSLPEELQGNVVLDKKRQAIVDTVLNAEPGDNFVIIGDPGLGKTVILFEILDRLMKGGNAGILTTESIGTFHLENGIRLFYDDLPGHPAMADAVKAIGIKGLVVTARLEDWDEQCRGLDESFTRLSINPFSDKKMNKVSNTLLDLVNISREKNAVELLVKYAEGTPIYVWLMIKEMINNNNRYLTVDYIKKHASKGMINYVGRLLQGLLKDGPDFKKGGYHTLTMLYFLATYMTKKQCHTAYFREVSDCLDKYTTEMFHSQFDMNTQSRVMYYLSGGGDMMRFPHDAWPDVLAKRGKQNPFIQDIVFIEEDIADAGIFDKVKEECIVRAWNRMENRYSRNPNRTRESFLNFGEFFLSNFRPKTLMALGVDLEYLRDLCIQHSDIESSKVILSKLDHMSRGNEGNIINILGDVHGDAHLGDKRIGDDLGGLDADAMESWKNAKETMAREETERRRIEREEKQDLYDFEIVSSEMGISGEGDGIDSYRQLLIDALFDEKISEDEEKMLSTLREQLGISQEEHDKLLAELREEKGMSGGIFSAEATSMDDIRSLLDRCISVGMDVEMFEDRYRKIKRFFGFGWEEKVKLRLPGLSGDILAAFDTYMDEMGEEMIRLQDELDDLINECIEKDIEVDGVRERYDMALEHVRDERFAEARDTWSELREELLKLMETSAERSEWRSEALRLVEELDHRVKHCQRIDFELGSGFTKIRDDIDELIKKNSYRDAIPPLKMLVADLDDQISKFEEKKETHDVYEEWENAMGMKFVRIPKSKYFLGKYTVTRKEWWMVMGTAPWRQGPTGLEGDDFPATHVSWGDCMEFVKKLNGLEGEDGYRLPTEEEWEEACRAGEKGKYCFGNNEAKLDRYAWYDRNAAGVGEKYPHRVGMKKPNRWGLYDMHGNVWEWCQDWYDSSNLYRTARGGSWGDYPNGCVSSYRYGFIPDCRDDYLGFRILRVKKNK